MTKLIRSIAAVLNADDRAAPVPVLPRHRPAARAARAPLVDAASRPVVVAGNVRHDLDLDPVLAQLAP